MTSYPEAQFNRSNRRRFLTTLTIGSLAYCVPGAFAEELTRTPLQTEGPFYPDTLPLDTDNDLIVINDSLTPAVGQITYLSGRILDLHGQPVRNAQIEIWQVDGHGVYLHSKSNNREIRDTHFQGFGRFLTGSTGEYLFRTVKPVPYPGRTSHIHFAVKVKGQERFTTQCYVQGEPKNDSDFVLKSIQDARSKASVIIPFAALPGSAAGELAARFDIVLGLTPRA